MVTPAQATTRNQLNELEVDIVVTWCKSKNIQKAELTLHFEILYRVSTSEPVNVIFRVAVLRTRQSPEILSGQLLRTKWENRRSKKRKRNAFQFQFHIRRASIAATVQMEPRLYLLGVAAAATLGCGSAQWTHSDGERRLAAPPLPPPPPLAGSLLANRGAWQLNFDCHQHTHVGPCRPCDHPPDVHVFVRHGRRCAHPVGV